ncbi:uncharacterized protein LOC114871301 isoform X2 [Osmia bicornis bicornis]|uniref:uncharacterized protein LOC114871301 isoform X2 n=1 Tax=Osmia bicornis bicornis TaxID=1437191 RepID=UPI0010F61F6E|nr:uncharacterized protein LOC114871301 isoform X2 [Osmia bicornis bicornis]
MEPPQVQRVVVAIFRIVLITHEEEDNEEEKNDENEGATDTAASKEKLPLPTPDFNSTPVMKTSVFSNPFVEAEKAKSAILEKHVKMTPTLDDTKMINGRKICWNYRKGRCRFGHNCTFAHDSDLHRTAAELEAIRIPQETVICQTQYNGQVSINDDDEVDQENNQMNKRKKRPGLSQSLIPSKKVLKMYKSQQTKAISR